MQVLSRLQQLGLMLLLLLVVFTSTAGIIYAQDATNEAIPTGVTGTKETHEAEISKLRQQLLAEIEAYRRADQQFRIAKQQYENLETLKSLEEAVQATKQAMYERSRVLTTYHELLYFTLLDADGVNFAFKDTQVTALETRIEELRAHTAKVEQATSRDDVNALRDEFASLKPLVEDTSFRTMSLIRIGEMQSVYDKSRIILTDLEESLSDADVSALKKAERERAFAETDRSLTQLKAEIDTVHQIYATQEDLVRKNIYDRILRELSPIYAKLSQNLSYLAELLRV